MSLPTSDYERIKSELESFDARITAMMNQLHPPGHRLPTRRDEHSRLWEELGDTHYYLVTAIEYAKQIIDNRAAKESTV